MKIVMNNGFNIKSALIVLALFCLSTSGAISRTYVVPHILDTKGNITTPNTFDTTIFATYSGGLIDGSTPGSATVDFYLFDESTGLPAVSKEDDEICNPCTFDFGNGEDRQQAIKVEELIQDAGGFKNPLFSGFGFLVTDSPKEDLNVQYAIEASQKGKTKTQIRTSNHIGTGPFCSASSAGQRSLFQISPPDFAPPIPVISDFCNVTFIVQGPPNAPIIFTPILPDPSTTPPDPVIIVPINPQTPHGGGGDNDTTITPPGGMIDPNTPKRINSELSFQRAPGLEQQCSRRNQSSFDTIINFLNISGVNDSTFRGGFVERLGGSDVPIDLYLFDQAGNVALSSTNKEVCNPCSFTLGTTNTRKKLIKIDDLIKDAGGFSKPVFLGFAAVVVNGDADNVNVTSAVVNSKNSSLDIAPFNFEPQEINPSSP